MCHSKNVSAELQADIAVCVRDSFDAALVASSHIRFHRSETAHIAAYHKAVSAGHAAVLASVRPRAHASVLPSVPVDEPLSVYEEDRLRNIAGNKEYLTELGLGE